MNDTVSKITEKLGFAGEMPALADPARDIARSEGVASAMYMHQPGLRRFTLNGDGPLERHLTSVCSRIRDEICALIPATRIDGLLLGGGYGRGEGGVLRTGAGDQPYNDLEFYVFVCGNAILAERRYRAALHELGQRLSPAAGLEVEFKILTFEKLRRAAPSMFYYDLVAGHRWLIGDDSLLAGCDHHRDPSRIPLHEATRLLMNRCSGLLFSAERLSRMGFGPEESDFVGRNLAKVQLALGDVLLAAAGHYHWSCQERHKRLLALQPGSNEPWRDAVYGHHSAGVSFKLYPVRSTDSRESLSGQHTQLSALARQLWLLIESRRLATNFTSPREYALSACHKCPETSPLRNRLVNAQAFGPAAALEARGAHYPRERLLHALCLLLWEHNALADPSLLQRVQRELNTRAEDSVALVAAYEALWHRFN